MKLTEIKKRALKLAEIKRGWEKHYDAEMCELIAALAEAIAKLESKRGKK